MIVLRARVLKWHIRFSGDLEQVENDERLGRSVTARTEGRVEKINEIFADRPTSEHSDDQRFGEH